MLFGFDRCQSPSNNIMTRRRGHWRGWDKMGCWKIGGTTNELRLFVATKWARYDDIIIIISLREQRVMHWNQVNIHPTPKKIMAFKSKRRDLL